MHIHRRRRGLPATPVALLAAILLATLAALFFTPAMKAAAADEIGPAIYVIPVKQSVESGLQSFLERAYKEAEEAKAEHVILVINTLGGKVVNAEEIGHFIRGNKIPTTAFVEGKAVSAGTYIALNADNIVMQPGSTIGAAAVVDGSGDLIDNPKTVSFWTSEMSESAGLQGRDKSIAAAMVDPNVVLKLQDKIGRNKEQGEILTLSASEAEKLGYSEHTAANVDEVAQWLGLDGRTQIEVAPTLAENAARWLINPVVMTVLLILGIAGIVIEMLVPGFGAPGIVGLLSFGLYFFGHYVAGFAGMESVVLFVIGIALLVIEVFVPSFGILGILGSAALIAGVVTAASDPMTAFISIVIALVAAVILIVIFVRMNKSRGIWNKFILRDKLTTEDGFISADRKESLLGLQGLTITPLRPAGTVLIGDARIDVVTSGEFIDSNRSVTVIKAEGTWVVVKEISK
ncbi:membrane-bound serine protease (ClpP class) [Paenibacillus endophyticus]|uniref:Membrane-bound serine protease (ClpP class) n=1 Tax=Paenibacillus endophyticus TaxID=1294268 RepID=A0A7W5G8Y9_9BACL|nr:nodulation protein NfeD [Paenibacillus endophyticus]MBB3151121.1 membrane-bound serine protease (ClpP class) [Paenibacillus endophyticus]